MGGIETSTRGILGAGTAGFLELFLFHPVDTIAKRLMYDRSKDAMRSMRSLQLRKIVFRDAAGKGVLSEIGSLYPAFGFAVLYKIIQRSLQFGIHPIINNYLRTNHEAEFRAQFGERWAKTVIAGSGGVLIGISEVVLLPLDALKVKGQTGVKIIETAPSFGTAETEKIRARMNLIKSLPRITVNLYRGASWTAVRNSFGCFALFGTSTYIKDNIFHLHESPQSATLYHHFIASLSGACASIIVACPMDVIKVRMQATSLNSKNVSGWVILKDLVCHEGIWAFTKGVGPKLIASAPKVTFSFTVAQWLADLFNK